MDHNISLISTLAAGFGIALILGFIAERIKVPALVGYLLAGILIGPATPGFVANMHIASQLSEIGVMLLMFGVGLHFSLNGLLAVKRIAVPGAVVQMGLATVLGIFMAWWWGWHWGSGLIFGLSLSCASTVVLLKALEARGVLDSMNGRIAVGWLVVEDRVLRRSRRPLLAVKQRPQAPYRRILAPVDFSMHAAAAINAAHAWLPDADLIVMGKHGQSVMEELLLGSVTKHVLAHSSSDVLIADHA